MKSVQIYKKILVSRVDFFRKMLQFRPSDIKKAKIMMDGPVLGRFSVVLGTVRHKFREKHVGRCVEALWQTGHGISAVEISPLDILGRYDASGRAWREVINNSKC